MTPEMMKKRNAIRAVNKILWDHANRLMKNKFLQRYPGKIILEELKEMNSEDMCLFIREEEICDLEAKIDIKKIQKTLMRPWIVLVMR